jgi:hypothetical protein
MASDEWLDMLERVGSRHTTATAITSGQRKNGHSAGHAGKPDRLGYVQVHQEILNGE